MTGQQRRGVLVSDFDGTLTRNDFFRLVVEGLAPAELDEFWQGYLSGKYTHFEALRGIFGSIRATEDELLALVSRAGPPPNLARWVARLNAAGWDVVIASAGCAWYIDRILATCGVTLEVHANPGHFSPEVGLVMQLPVESPYFCPRVGIDKAAIVRAAIADGRVVAFAGDGFPDAPAAKLVPPARRFARADLATALDREGLPYRRFEQWSEVAEGALAMPFEPLP